MSKIKNKSAFILVGMPGSGKSTLSKKISKKLGAKYLSSDKIRNELFKSARYSNAGHQKIKKIREKTYTVLYQRAVKFLSEGKKVIIDATHLDLNKRLLAIKTLSAVIDKNKMCFVVVSTPIKIIEQRMQQQTTELANETETLYEGWKRVVSYFIKEFESGKLTWPTKSENIDRINYLDFEHELEK